MKEIRERKLERDSVVSFLVFFQQSGASERLPIITVVLKTGKTIQLKRIITGCIETIYTPCFFKIALQLPCVIDTLI